MKNMNYLLIVLTKLTLLVSGVSGQEKVEPPKPEPIPVVVPQPIAVEPVPEKVTKPKITFPVVKVTAPKANVVMPISLPSGYWYVLESDTDLIIRSFPDKAFGVFKSKGPATFAGLFVGGNDENEIKVFKGTFVTAIQAGRGITGFVAADVVPVNVSDETLISRLNFDFGGLSPPKPDPIVVPPIPDAPPVVVPGAQLNVNQKRVFDALIGTTAKSDAVTLAAAAEVIQTSMSKYVVAAQLQKHWGQLLDANKWVHGSRPDITKFIEENIPPEPTNVVPKNLTDADRERFTTLFHDIEIGAKERLK